MRKRKLALFILIVMGSLCLGHDDGYDLFERVDLDWDHGDVMISANNHHSEIITITRDNQLLIDDKPVQVDESTVGLLIDYRLHMRHIRRQARSIGVAGIRIGAAATGIAVTAVLSALESVFSDSDEENFHEPDGKIEDLTDEIEEKTDDLEETADKLKTIHRRLRYTVPELEDLGWF